MSFSKIATSENMHYFNSHRSNCDIVLDVSVSLLSFGFVRLSSRQRVRLANKQFFAISLTTKLLTQSFQENNFAFNFVILLLVFIHFRHCRNWHKLLHTHLPLNYLTIWSPFDSILVLHHFFSIPLVSYLYDISEHEIS